MRKWILVWSVVLAASACTSDGDGPDAQPADTSVGSDRPPPVHDDAAPAADDDAGASDDVGAAADAAAPDAAASDAEPSPPDAGASTGPTVWTATVGPARRGLQAHSVTQLHANGTDVLVSGLHIPGSGESLVWFGLRRASDGAPVTTFGDGGGLYPASRTAHAFVATSSHTFDVLTTIPTTTQAVPTVIERYERATGTSTRTFLASGYPRGLARVGRALYALEDGIRDGWTLRRYRLADVEPDGGFTASASAVAPSGSAPRLVADARGAHVLWRTSTWMIDRRALVDGALEARLEGTIDRAVDFAVDESGYFVATEFGRIDHRTLAGGLDPNWGVVWVRFAIYGVVCDGDRLYIYGAEGPVAAQRARIEARRLVDGGLDRSFAIGGVWQSDAVAAGHTVTAMGFDATGVYAALSAALPGNGGVELTVAKIAR